MLSFVAVLICILAALFADAEPARGSRQQALAERASAGDGQRHGAVVVRRAIQYGPAVFESPYRLNAEQKRRARVWKRLGDEWAECLCNKAKAVHSSLHTPSFFFFLLCHTAQGKHGWGNYVTSE
jgi:hypothetical protein